MRFSSLTLEDFGPYKGVQTLDLTGDDGVTIIWGNNGRGKTTLLNAFRYALYGKVYGRNARMAHSLQKIGNWESFDEGKYGFRVSLNMEVDGVDYELTRQYSVRSGVTVPRSDNDYKEDVFLKKGGTFVSPNERDHILQTIMPEKVSRFFLFDAELLGEYEELLNDESAMGPKIKNSIEGILGVPILINGHTDTNEILKEYRKDMSKLARHNQHAEKVGTLLEAKQSELETHEAERDALREELETLKSAKQTIEEEMSRTERIRDLLNQKGRLEETIVSKKAMLSDTLRELQSLTKQAWKGMLGTRIGSVVEELNKAIEELKEKDARHVYSEQLMAELRAGIGSGRCPMCEQPMDNDLICRLEEELKHPKAGFASLTQEEKTNLIEMQARKTQLERLITPNLRDEIRSLEARIAGLKVDISDAEQQLAAVERQLSGVEDMDGIASLVKEYANCVAKISIVEQGIQKQEEKINDIKLLIRELEDQLKKHGGGDLKIAENKRNFCEQLTDIFDKGVELYRERLKDKVEQDASDVFLRISNEPDYCGLRINENYGLSIIHRGGRTIEIRSAGYEHIVALSLIGALHKNAPLQGPIIMDSPFGRLDPDHKEKMVAALPSLSEQVILFVYEDEVDTQLVRRLLGSTLQHEYSLERISAMHTKIIET